MTSLGKHWKLSEITKRKLRENHRGALGKHWKLSDETKKRYSENHKGLNNWSKGRPRSEETKQKISESHKRRASMGYKPMGISKPVPSERRRKISLSLRGKNIGAKGSNWQGGKTSMGKILRNRIEYKEWRSNVFTRDDWTCQTCGKRGGEIEAHHIKPFAYYPELIFNIDNGLTLCVDCHKQTDSYLAKAKKHKSVGDFETYTSEKEVPK